MEAKDETIAAASAATTKPLNPGPWLAVRRRVTAAAVLCTLSAFAGRLLLVPDRELIEAHLLHGTSFHALGVKLAGG